MTPFNVFFLNFSDLPHRSILNTLFFVIHINNLSYNIASHVKQKYAHAHVYLYVIDIWIGDPQIQQKAPFMISYIGKKVFSSC